MSTPSQPGSGPEPSKDQSGAKTGAKTGAGGGAPGDRGSSPASSPGGPPPWARGAASGRGTAVVDAPTSYIRRENLPSDMPDLSETRRSATEAGHHPEPQPAARGGSRGPRRAALQLKRFDPWSVFKLSVVLAVALFLIWMIAVGVLYLVLDGMGVWSRINTTFSDFVTVSNPGGTTELIGPGRVFGVAAVIGLVNVLLFSAIATVSAFVYNLSSDLVGGFEVTLTERD